MKSYKPQGYPINRMYINQSTEGETIEQKVDRIVNNKEPIKDGAPIIYTPRKEGVRASTNIRTDRFEVALEATDKIAKSYKARRENRMKDADKSGKPEPIQGKTAQDGTTETSKSA